MVFALFSPNWRSLGKPWFQQVLQIEIEFSLFPVQFVAPAMLTLCSFVLGRSSGQSALKTERSTVSALKFVNVQETLSDPKLNGPLSITQLGVGVAVGGGGFVAVDVGKGVSVASGSGVEV